MSKRVPMAYCPATGMEDCDAGDMRCVGGECWRLREQRKAELAARGEEIEAAGDDWLEATRANAAERAAAAKEGKGVCPACGDWLPLELHEFRCLGKGHHVAIGRDSVFPKLTAAEQAKVDGDFEHALGRVVVIVVALLLVIALALLFSALAKSCGSSSPAGVPPARVGAS